MHCVQFHIDFIVTKHLNVMQKRGLMGQSSALWQHGSAKHDHLRVAARKLTSTEASPWL